MFKIDFVDKFFKKNPIYFLDSIRYERQKIQAQRDEESMTSERWIQFWGVVITLLVIPFGVYLVRHRYMEDSGVWLQVFGLILTESVFLCSLMIAVIWEGFNSFTRDLKNGVFETVMTTLLEPGKIVWGKFMHVFVHFLKFLLTGFLILFIVSPISGIHPTLILIILALDLAAGCYIISHRIYISAREAYHKARSKSGNGDEGKEIYGISKLFTWIERSSIFIIPAFIFIQVQLILLTNNFGEMAYYPHFIMKFLGNYPLTFVVYLFIPVVFVLLLISAYLNSRTEKMLGEII
ncbi:MAG: hypothetical protein K8T10_07345 [Candidatus Eremiobacteraeota bacterium]|nr:hypothetical protein [Candidatus Eremiobacteraeota bacterium]